MVEYIDILNSMAWTVLMVSFGYAVGLTAAPLYVMTSPLSAWVPQLKVS
jgi:hypothetical protein